MTEPQQLYVSCTRNPLQATQIKNLEAVQRKAAHFAIGQHNRQTSPTGLMQELQWRTLQECRLVARLAKFYKTINGLAACYIPQDSPPVTHRKIKPQHPVPASPYMT